MSSNFNSKLSVFDDSDGFNCNIALFKFFTLSFNDFFKFENPLFIILFNDSLPVIFDFKVSKGIVGEMSGNPNTAPVITAK